MGRFEGWERHAAHAAVRGGGGGRSCPQPRELSRGHLWERGSANGLPEVSGGSLRQNELGRARVVPDVEPLSPRPGNAGGEPGGRHAVAAGDVRIAIQPPAAGTRASVPRTLQEPAGGPRRGIGALVPLHPSESGASATLCRRSPGGMAVDEPSRKAMQVDRMSQGWVVGSTDFKIAVALKQRRAAAALAQGDCDAQQVREALQQKLLDQLLRKARRRRSELCRGAKMTDWKVALAAAMKARTTVTNRWLAEQLHMGSLHEVSRRVAALQRKNTIYKT